MKKREFYDDAEKQLVEAYERDEFKPVRSQKAAKRAAIDAARPPEITLGGPARPVRARARG